MTQHLSPVRIAEFQWARGLSNNGTASGDSGWKTAGLPPLGVPGPAAEKPTDIAAQVVTKAVLGATGVGKPAPAP